MTNSQRTSYNQQTYYICGQCKDKQWHLVNEKPVIPCPDCGWWHKDTDKYNLPSEIKLDLSQY